MSRGFLFTAAVAITFGHIEKAAYILQNKFREAEISASRM